MLSPDVFSGVKIVKNCVGGWTGHQPLIRLRAYRAPPDPQLDKGEGQGNRRRGGDGGRGEERLERDKGVKKKGKRREGRSDGCARQLQLLDSPVDWRICCSGRPYRASQFQVRLGGILATDPDPDAVYANVSYVIPRTDYVRAIHHNDIGLLRLTSPVQYTDTILPICLPSPTVNLDQFKVCVDTGFGRTTFNGLSHLHFATAECRVLSINYKCRKSLE